MESTPTYETGINSKAEQSWNQGPGKAARYWQPAIEVRHKRGGGGGMAGAALALVREAGRLHVVAGSVCQAPSGEKREALGFLQHHLQLLEVLQPSHVFVLGRRGTRSEEAAPLKRASTKPLTFLNIVLGSFRIFSTCSALMPSSRQHTLRRDR